MNEALARRRDDQQFRLLQSLRPAEGTKVTRDGNTYIDFSSNDYLGLSAHPDVLAKAKEYVEKFGAGSAASRLITGTYSIHEELEEQLAATFNREAGLLFNSGFQANSTILGTVTDRHSLILADKLSHNSLLQGALSGRANFQRFRHNDLNHLEELLERATTQNYNRIWIVTETVFSMDGDCSPIRKIADLAAKYDAYLFADDAHAVGVWGDRGLGLAKDFPEVDILLGTCGKAFGSFGAYVACSKEMKEYLVNFCPGFIYTTALPPAVIGATTAALELLPNLEQERKSFHERIEKFRQDLQQLGFNTGPSTTQIIPVIIGGEKQTMDLSKRLEKNGFLTTAVRPPTVPEGSSRLRLTLASKHTDNQLKSLISAFKNWIDE